MTTSGAPYKMNIRKLDMSAKTARNETRRFVTVRIVRIMRIVRIVRITRIICIMCANIAVLSTSSIILLGYY